jgi:hypothetical protein
MSGGILVDDRSHVWQRVDLETRFIDLDAVAGREDDALGRVANGEKQTLTRVERGIALVSDMRDKMCRRSHASDRIAGRGGCKRDTEVFRCSP